MKKVFIIHGWDGRPDEPLLKWLKISLQSKGFAATAPAMPDPARPVIKDWVGKLRQTVGAPDKNVIFIGHSIGCQAILRYLAGLPAGTKIGGLVLLAPWMELDRQTIEEEGPESIAIAKPWQETPLDLAKVKQTTAKIVAIFSDNDPFVPLAQQDLFARELGAQIIVEHHKGHFDPSSQVSHLASALRAVSGF
ncbi:MAG: hypothetical protein UV78_C0036G0002 [Parcubacteria group bacterium GW2011_GWA2_43_17]|nr:MAG: hypothetical protein UV78_C0036G0002 [Parcubacteria group bacterium GW2011_GWA2_43_17]KKT91378.1 MAG: hypothetical protein UW91_C0033G0008 [Parcubacteria group bacterium GW2011_GWF2_45_11]KKT97063.1 MAG: hypothetical protein UW98_C0025G0009 [Parcubacteria group bacterium GW2011_GWC2_45_15]OGY92403.1 MAG: hypothetical protein A2260_01820 [Candidatus Komeilibacteria bacterium RIFOXYA2_FULL_45_9]OGY96162.1 MAG: hypothetical protein A3J95_01135 [Candidatus Komeilibacteria bacterium RIFOXYC2